MNTVHIVGAGGIGCVLGYALTAAKWSVTMVEANPRKIDRGLSNGLQVDARPAKRVMFTPFDDWRPSETAFVLLATKCYDNAAVLEKLPRTATVVPVQNGFDPQLHAFGHAYEGIASFVSECERDRPATRITRPGDLHLGPRTTSPDTPRWAALVAALRTSPLFRTVVVPAIEPFKSTKLLYNAAISPIAAAAGLDNGQLLSRPEARRLFFALIQENHGILTASRVPLGKVGPFRPDTVAAILRRRWLAALMAKAFEPSLRGTYCSMAGDIERGRTEIDNYNGHLIRLADAAGTPCPLNRMVHAVVSRMASERATPGEEVLREFSSRSYGSPDAVSVKRRRLSSTT